MKIVNHVMSQDIHSNILNSFIRYLSQANATDIHITSVEPIDNADIYHYHRPHLETKLMPNSTVTVHHDLMESDPWLSLSKFLKVYKQAETVVCLNTTQKSILSEHGISNTHVVPHGYHSSIFTPSSEYTEFAKEKITLGLISKRYGRRVKGEAYFHELIKRLDNDKFDFILVGDDRTEEYFLLKSYGFEVRVYERLPYRMFGSLYKEIDLLLMLSIFEGGPANVPEAIASSVPIAGFPIGMIPDFVEEGKNGLILSGGVDYDAEKIMSLSCQDEIDNLKRSAMKLNTIAPTWEDVAQMYDNIYNSMVVS